MGLSRREFMEGLILLGSDALVGCRTPERVSSKATPTPASVSNLILDFDGTLSDIEKEVEPFVEGYIKGAARELGLSRAELNQYWEAGTKTVLGNPSDYGWKRDGRIVASPTSDPLIMCHSTLDAVLTRLGRLPSAEERTALTEKLFQENYGKMTVVFKPHTDEFLSEVYGLFGGDVQIVTNSSTGKVEKKIAKLPSDHSRIPVLGGAKKYEVDSSWGAVPETLNVDGLGRPIFLRRRYYGETLSRIMDDKSITAGNVVVVGDIWELDLALPQYLGMAVGFTPHQTTPEFEKKVVADYGRGFLAKDLETVYANLKELRA